MSDGVGMDGAGALNQALDQLIYEIACDEVPYTRYSPREVLQVQDRRRRRMEELKSLIMGEKR